MTSVTVCGFKIGLIRYPLQNSAKYHFGVEYEGKLFKIKRIRIGITIWTK